MALQASGQISLDDLHVEAGGTTGTECSLNDADIRDIISKGAGAQNGLSEYYGQRSAVSGFWAGYQARLPDGNLTWSNVNIGTPAANRYVISYHAYRTATGGGAAASVTSSANIAGQTTTKLAELPVSSSTRAAGGQVNIANVPTGTTCTISISTSVGSVWQAATAWVMYGINPTYASYATSSAADPNLSINVEEGDMIIAGCAAGYAASNSAASWTGVTENFDWRGSDNNHRHISGGTHFSTADQSPRTISLNRAQNNDISRTAFAMAFR